MNGEGGLASRPRHQRQTGHVERNTAERGELLERYGAIAGEVALALTFTRTNDPRKGDPKQGPPAGGRQSPYRTRHEVLRS